MSDENKTPAATPPVGGTGTPSATPPSSTQTSHEDGTQVTPPIKGNQPPKKDDKAEGSSAAPVVPEKYDIKLPEGSLIDKSALADFETQAKAEGLTQEQAQKRIERDSALLASYAKQQEEKLDAESTAWLESVKIDKEIGGEAIGENVEIAKRVVQKFGTPQLMEDLNRTRLGNYPEFVRMMVRIGKAMSEDQLIVPGASTPKQEKSIEDIFYGDTTPSQTN